MSEVNEPARQQMTDAGVPACHHDELLSLKAPLEAKGVNWLGLLSMLPQLIEIFKKLSGGAQPAPKV